MVGLAAVYYICCWCGERGPATVLRMRMEGDALPGLPYGVWRVCTAARGGRHKTVSRLPSPAFVCAYLLLYRCCCFWQLLRCPCSHRRAPRSPNARAAAGPSTKPLMQIWEQAGRGVGAPGAGAEGRRGSGASRVPWLGSTACTWRSHPFPRFRWVGGVRR